MYLNCHTFFSFKYGTLSPKALFDEARKHGIRKLALTDINNTSAPIEMLRVCNEERAEYDLQIAAGLEFRRDDQLLYIGLARNNEGFRELNSYLSHHNLKKKPLFRRAPQFRNAHIIYPFGSISPQYLDENEWIGIRLQDLSRFPFSDCAKFKSKMLILHPVTFNSRAGFNVHRLLRAMDQNTLLSKLNPGLQAAENEFMMPLENLEFQFRLFPELIQNTRKLLDECHFTMDFHTNKNKKAFTESLEADHEKLRSLALEGFLTRYQANDTQALRRLEHELEIIRKKNFEAYFLISHDILAFAHHRNFEHVGRGSGANSIVAYCLGITNVDPIELDLYFERFLNPQRSSPPDFDIDFSWKDRDEVTQYIFNRYGTSHAALLGTHTTLKSRSILRELGKVFGLPKPEIDQMVEYPEHYRNKDHITQLIFRYARRMLKIPANLSIHAGGVLITEEPIAAYTAVDLPPKGFPTTHFDMHTAEDIGIYKFDILSQRGLGHIKDSVAIIKRNQGIKEDIHRFSDFKKDPEIRQLLSSGRTMGCFYVESPAMRMLLGKLRCSDYITLVAASSIIRPGVARSGMMRAYIERHHSGGNYESIHPKMDELMHETYGVMVYQEDVIRVAHHFAGLSLSEADILRRGMSGKFRSRKEFLRVQEAFFRNCREKQYDEAVIERVWFEIESFSGYSFSKGHSASYAVESYQSLYLKAHYPLEFMVGVINNFGGFYKTEFYFHEARMDGARVEAPCVNHSDAFTNIYGHTIYIGFVHLKSLEAKLGNLIPEERHQNGPYLSLDNFLRRIVIGIEQLRILIRIGAFRFTGKNKRSLLREALLYFSESKSTRHSFDLFNMEATPQKLPELDKSPFEDAFDELELLGFPLCDPFLLVDASYRDKAKADELMGLLNRQIEIVGYLITIKNTSTKNSQLMNFGTFYDYEGKVFDTVHFPDTARKHPFRGKGFYRVRGKVVQDFGYPMIEVSEMERLPFVKKEVGNSYEYNQPYQVTGS